jgi:hypothetical protein
MGFLKDFSVRIARARVSRKVHTERITPMPTKMTFAGDDTWKMEGKPYMLNEQVPIITRPTPSPRLEERA